MKVVLIGGHLAPALSVLEALPKNTKVLFVGRKYSFEGDNALTLEYKTINSLNIPFVGLNTGRLQRKFTKHTIFSLLKVPFGVVKSFLILSNFRPDVVVGFGGYVSIPVIFAAFLLNVPVVIHEQTMEIGLANKIVSLFAKKICISWNSSRKYFPSKKTVMTGNPIRNFPVFNFNFSIFNNKLPIIYVTGGSSGSHFINTLIGEIIEELLRKYNVIHQVGDAQEFHDYDRLMKLKETLPEEIRDNYILEKFIEPSHIGDLMTASSLIVSRSGINTVTEIIYYEKPALLIPLPHAQKNEQMKNAQYVEKIGLGLAYDQPGLNAKKLLRTINSMFAKISKFKLNKEKFDYLLSKNAAVNIVSVINYVYRNKTKKTC